MGSSHKGTGVRHTPVSPFSGTRVQHIIGLAHNPGTHNAPARSRSTSGKGLSKNIPLLKRAIITAFNATTYTASVLILEATSTYLTGVPVSCHMDGTSALSGALCVVLFFDQQNASDAVVLAVYPNGNQGIPTPAPGRSTFVTGFKQINASVITAGSTSTFTLTGSGGIPGGALGVFYKAFFTSATVGAYLQIAPHGASDITAYETVGNIQVANATINGCGVLQLDSNGQIDIKANNGNCTVTLYTHGYVF